MIRSACKERRGEGAVDLYAVVHDMVFQASRTGRFCCSEDFYYFQVKRVRKKKNLCDGADGGGCYCEVVRARMENIQCLSCSTRPTSRAHGRRSFQRCLQNEGRVPYLTRLGTRRSWSVCLYTQQGIRRFLHPEPQFFALATICLPFAELKV